MTLALRVLAMFTLSMGTLILKGALHIYGWLPAHIALVMGVAFFLINIGKINKKYFDSINMHKFNSKGFKKTRFRIRKCIYPFMQCLSLLVTIKKKIMAQAGFDPSAQDTMAGLIFLLFNCKLNKESDLMGI